VRTESTPLLVAVAGSHPQVSIRSVTRHTRPQTRKITFLLATEARIDETFTMR
jgi:hypothetical protein